MTFSFGAGKVPDEPILLFDETDTSAVHTQVYWGLRNYGPFDKRSRVLHAAILAPSASMSEMNRLIDELNSGTPIFPGGMPSFFRCKIEVITKEEIAQKADTEQYENHGLTLAKSMDPREVDVVLCHIPRTSEFFYRTPYYRLKAIFASHGFSSQMVTPYMFKNLKWSHLNLATAIFAKAGHIPWALGNELSADMILGVDISHVVAIHTRAGGFRRFIGYVNVFDSFGRWLFFEGLAQPYAKEEMGQSLQRLLTSAVLRYRAIKHTDPRNISIYLWKVSSNEDRRASEKVIHDIVSGCSVMFISVDSSHPFRLFDLRTKDGSFPRGAYVEFGDGDILLSTTGESAIAGRKQGTPRPLHLRVWNSSLERQEIARQVLALTKLNWASATSVMREPVTLVYSEQLAHLTAAISEQEWSGITSPEVSQSLSDKPWFI